MNFIKTSIDGLYIIEPKVFGDHRGWFFESFNLNALEKTGLSFHPVQANHSYTAKAGTIRGLHFQLDPHAQAKIVRCTRGRIRDYAVDLRHNSGTFMNWESAELDNENKKQLFIPKGFAHAFISLTDDVEIQYIVDDYYAPAEDRSICYSDPDICINWEITDPILSDKDKNAPFYKESDCNF